MSSQPPAATTPKAAAPSAAGGGAPPVASLPTGKKDYLKRSIQWPPTPWGSLQLTADDKFNSFCRVLEPNQPAPQFTTSMSRSVLEQDGFVLGRLVNSGKDQEAFGQMRYSVYEVMFQLPLLIPTFQLKRLQRLSAGRVVAGEYVVLLFLIWGPDQIDPRYSSSHLDLRAMCMSDPRAIPRETPAPCADMSPLRWRRITRPVGTCPSSCLQLTLRRRSFSLSSAR
jgi:hypothetical protein